MEQCIEEVKVPDIGDFKDIPVIEVLVKPGDSVKAEDPLITLESDKATMEVPAPVAGVVKEIKVKVGDKVSEGTLRVDARSGRAAAAAPRQAGAGGAADSRSSRAATARRSANAAAPHAAPACCAGAAASPTASLEPIDEAS